MQHLERVQGAVLLLKIVDHLALLVVHPPGECDEHELQWKRHRDHSTQATKSAGIGCLAPDPRAKAPATQALGFWCIEFLDSTPEAEQPTGLSADTAWAALDRAGAAVREAMRAGDGLALGTVFMPHLLFASMPLDCFLAFVGAHETRQSARDCKNIRGVVEMMNSRIVLAISAP